MAMAGTVSVLFVLVCVSVASADAEFVGGPRPIADPANDLQVEQLAKFAVDQYKSHLKSASDISFSKVLAAKEQVVQGTMYYITIEVKEGGVPKQYEAKVWVKPWEGFKELESFKPSTPSHYDSAADLTAESGDLKKEKIGA